jgi:hypothetical protein
LKKKVNPTHEAIHDSCVGLSPLVFIYTKRLIPKRRVEVRAEPRQYKQSASRIKSCTYTNPRDTRKLKPVARKTKLKRVPIPFSHMRKDRKKIHA